MTGKKPLKSLIFIVFLSFSLLPVAACAEEELLKDEIIIRTQSGEEFVFIVELALTPYQQSKGLMNRTYMDDNAGMLFVFERLDKRNFWMKNTLIPLDMLFLARDGEIHHIHQMAKPQSLARITSEHPALAVLELNGGTTEKLGITEGDVVIHSSFRNTNALVE